MHVATDDVFVVRVGSVQEYRDRRDLAWELATRDLAWELATCPPVEPEIIGTTVNQLFGGAQTMRQFLGLPDGGSMQDCLVYVQ